MTADASRSAVDNAVRTAYGRLIALLAARFRDIAAAEDALADAFASALATWPERGVPSSPEAWLFTAAKNKLESRLRHARVRDGAQPALAMRADELDAVRSDAERTDRRLELLFVCAHPAIDEASRTPLMLQTVLGLNAERIAAAFLVAPKTMGQRLVRAKTKIRDAGIAFAVPQGEERTERLADVLAAIYAAFGTGWDDLDGRSSDLASEAIYLGSLVASQLPDEPEALGLLSLMLFCESRRAARRGPDGEFISLADQDTARWSRDMLVEADRLLTTASRAACFGRFQCEAAIQSLHVQKKLTGTDRPDALRLLYDVLLAHCPTVGVMVARAAALCEMGDLGGAAQGLDQVLAVSPDAVSSYQPYWVTKAQLAERRGDRASARHDLQRAIGLTEDGAVRAFLSQRIARLELQP